MGRIFLWGSGGYLLGNILVGFEGSEIISILLLFLAAIVASGFLSSWRKSLLPFLAVLFCGIGFMVATAYDRDWERLPEERDQPFEGIVTKREPAKVFYQPLVLVPVEGSGIDKKVLWRAPRIVESVPGERIRLDCLLRRPENFDPNFDYARYLATQNIGYICEKEKSFEILSEGETWRTGLFHSQVFLRERIRFFLTDPAAGLLEGLFVGGDDGLSKELSESFRRAGLSHIVAVSGYNMSLVAFAALLLALLSGLWRKTAMLFATIGILVFLLLIDTSSASIRAACMAWIVAFAFFVGRPANAWNGLFLAGLLMAMYNPLLVRYDVGFQLSFLATLALIAASPWFEELMRREGWYWKILVLFLSTVVIELFIFPVLAFHFGTITLLAPLANLLVLPLIPVVMALGFLMFSLGSLLPVIGTLLSFPVWMLLLFIIHVGEGFGSLSWSMFANLAPSASFIVAWYVVLAGAVWYSRKSQYRYALRMDH